MDTIKDFDMIANSYDGNINKMKSGLQKMETRMNHLLDSVLQRQEHPNLLQRVFSTHNETKMEQLKTQYHETLKQWEKVTGAQYPDVLTDKGDRCSYQELKEKLDTFPDTKDGYYHIPDDLCTSDFSKKLRKDIEEFCKERHAEIPMGIGQKLEEIYRQPGKTWLHRTQIDFDDGFNLPKIANNGLICTAEDLENTATPCSSFPFFLSQTLYSSSYRQDSCLGAVIIKTDGEPRITDQMLEPDQIVGYVGCDHGKLHDFISTEEMANVKIEDLDIDSQIAQVPLDELIQEAECELGNDIEETKAIEKDDFERS